jgi:hypothetical protein
VALLCTFTHRDDVDIVLDYIEDTYKLTDTNILIFSNEDNRYEYYCVYNISGKQTLPVNTISVHRKSLTNTIYTINALNQIITNVNNGVLDKSYQLDWELYSNKLLLTNKGEVIKTTINLEKVYELLG